VFDGAVFFEADLTFLCEQNLAIIVCYLNRICFTVLMYMFCTELLRQYDYRYWIRITGLSLRCWHSYVRISGLHLSHCASEARLMQSVNIRGAEFCSPCSQVSVHGSSSRINVMDVRSE
jgi:hypothetical protein